MKLHCQVLVASLALGGFAQAQEAAPAASVEAHDSDEIVVLGAREEGVRIDRRVYTVRDDAEAQSTDMFEILGRIPSVSVSPEGGVTLLGASGVEVQINGQPAPGENLEQVLRGLPGSQVKRIEIVTNPSAQFSAAASGGIINIITKDRFEAGLAGSLRVGADTFGGGGLSVAPSWSGEKLTLNGWAGLHASGEDRATYGVRNTLPSGPNETKRGRNGFDQDGWYAAGNVTYKPTARRRYNGSLGADQFNYRYHEAVNLLSDAAPDSVRTTANDNVTDESYMTLEFQQDGTQAQALTKASLTLSRSSNTASSEIAERFAGVATPDRYRSTRENDTDTLNFTFDAERPRPSDRFFTFGAAIDLDRQKTHSALLLLDGNGPSPYAASLEGEESTVAAYATYQFNVGRWTMLPGLRTESYWRSVGAGGLVTEDDDRRVFPSVHVRRKLTDALNLDVSYTGRIRRPNFDQLDPVVRFFGDTASSGNPSLQPSTVDAYEANINYLKNKRAVSLTFFDRISHDVVGTRRDLVGDILYSKPVNAGENEERGLEAQARGPLGARWSYTISANALARSFDGLQSGVSSRRNVTQFSGNARLDYRDPDQDAIGADQLQLQLDVQGPSYDLQSEQHALAIANFTWRRRLTDSVVSVLSVNDVFASRKRTSEVSTGNYYERSTRDSPGARVRLTLTYQFGAASDLSQQPENGGGPKVPGG